MRGIEPDISELVTPVALVKPSTTSRHGREISKSLKPYVPRLTAFSSTQRECLTCITTRIIN